ncbi:MAG: YgjV family protein [Acutalibacteraceae bacterium]
MVIIIGNAVALFASLMMVLAGLLRDKNKIIITQTVQIGSFVVSNLILGGVSGAIVNAVSCVRNLLCFFGKFNKAAKIIMICLITGLSLYFNTNGIMGLLPVLSGAVFTAFLDVKDVYKFKWVVLSTTVPWLIYDIYLMSYTSAVFDVIAIISNAFAMYKMRHSKKQ